MNNIGSIMKQAQQMQARLQKLQEGAGEITFEASAGGGMVNAVANGRGELVRLEIKPEVAGAEDVAMLEDLVTAAVNEALRGAREAMAREMGKITGGLPIPGLM